MVFFNAVDTSFMLVGIGIGVLVTFVYSYLIAKWSIQDIVLPLKQLQVNIGQAAGGDLTQLTPVRGNDEIGEVTENFTRMLISLREAAALKSEKEAAEAANVAKSTFLANMSHELRTPLNAILGFAQLMTRDENLTQEQRENIATINRSGEHLLGLINDVLDMSKIESGRLTLHIVSFDFHSLLDGIEEMFTFRAAEKDLSLIVDRAADVPKYVRTDESKLRQVLMNLMSNAIKFTDQGGVSVRTDLRKKDDLQELLFEVEDTGQGITPEEIDALFEPFVQTQSGRQQAGGTGLGLPICRRYVELMGGRLSASSVPGQGSVFRFSVQIETTTAGEIRSTQQPRRVVGMAPGQPAYRILIAEDRDTNRLLLRKILSSLDFPLREASNGQEAIAVWEEWEPHLIFMDMRMPIVDGYEATKRIKATTRGQATVVIALTASAFENQRHMVLAEGCDDYIRKPFREHEIFEKLERHLGIQFLYDETSEARSVTGAIGRPLELSVDRLSTIPPEQLESLREATVRGDLEGMLVIINRIRETDVRSADVLASLASEFDYQTILSAIKSTGVAQ